MHHVNVQVNIHVSISPSLRKETGGLGGVGSRVGLGEGGLQSVCKVNKYFTFIYSLYMLFSVPLTSQFPLHIAPSPYFISEAGRGEYPLGYQPTLAYQIATELGTSSSTEARQGSTVKCRGFTDR